MHRMFLFWLFFQVEILEKDCSKKTYLSKNRDNYFYSKTFKNKCLTQGSEPASRDISPNNNSNNMHLHQKPTANSLNKQPSWYKQHRRYPKITSQQQTQNTTPHHKRKKQVKQHTSSQKLDVD